MDLLIQEFVWGLRNNMNEEMFKVIDGRGKEVDASSTDFRLVQKDSKIFDTKFKGKPTTFLKDAMRRFIKSKPALVGGIIVGILVLASIIVPMCSGNEGVYNIDSTNGGGNPVEANLTPKLFDAGTGFWDGTLPRTHIVYDNENEAPVGYSENTFFDVTTYKEYLDVTSQYGTGGYVNIYCTTSGKDANFYSTLFDYNLDGNVEYKISYTIADFTKNNYIYKGYKLSLFDGENKYYLVGDENNYVKDYGQSNLNVYSILKSKYNLSNITTDNILSARIYFEVENDSSLTGFMELESVTTSSNETDSEKNELFSSISFKDGNECLLREAGSSNYWNGDHGKIVNNVEVTYCDFTFDQYESAYGVKDASYSSKQLIAYINEGSLKVDFSNGTEATTDKELLKERFVADQSSLCPIIEVYEQVGEASKNSSGKYEGYTIKCKIYNYKQLGYSSMPRFIFGTNSSSKDYLKLLTSGMRFSFVLAIGVSAINITFGLIWGSISGYYGGAVDIAMERFCDIIGSLPTTVIITLCILYGQEWNWGAFSDVLALMVALFMTGWMGVAHRTRTQFYRFKGREYVLASRTLGAKDGRLIFKHILPNSMGTIITGSILMIPSVIYTETSIAYLGLGLSGQTMLGVIMAESNTYYRGDKAFLLYIPTVIMCLLLVSFNLFGNGLRDAFNPQLKGGD